APVVVAKAGLQLRGPRAVGIEDRDEPEDPEVFEPRRAFDERTEIEAVIPGGRRRLDGELEPRDHAWPDVIGRLHRDAVVARPSRRGRARCAVTAEWRDAMLTRLRPPRAQVGDLAHAPTHPAQRADDVSRYGRRRAVA